ncbi:LVIVD repeat-containing protein [Chloroflexota bacterium]
MRNNTGYTKNIEVLAYHDLDNKTGCQMAMQEVKGKFYLYIASMSNCGWHILEVTDPAKPRYVKWLEGPKEDGTKTLKIQIADGIMITSVQNNVEGIYIWDVKDPENPKFLSHWSTGVLAGNTHRNFYNGGRYVYLASVAKGFCYRILRIVDIIDPEHPVEVGRWWSQEQWVAGLKQNEREAYPIRPDAMNIDVWAGLHGPAWVHGNIAYCGWEEQGLIILDVSDPTLPQKLGQLKFHPPFTGVTAGAWCHTAVKMSKRPYVLFNSEGERFPLYTKEILANYPTPPMALLGIADVSDPSNPTLISMFPYPEVPPGFPFKNFNDMGLGLPGPFGPHNIHESHGPALEDRDDRTYCAYFHAGLRVYDISDPYVPKEIAYYIPPNPTKWLYGTPRPQHDPKFDLFAMPRGPKVATTEDVIVDHRGYIYLDMYHDGLWVCKCTV